MVSEVTSEFLAGYIEEVQSYIPSLKRGIIAIQGADRNKEVLNEVHRQVHIIKGASSMVGVDGLSQIAGHMENLVEHILDDSLPVSDRAIRIMDETIDRFTLFCKAIDAGDQIDEQSAIDKTAEDCRELIKTAGDPAGEQSRKGGDRPETISAAPVFVEFHQDPFAEEQGNEQFIDEFIEEAAEHLQDLHVQLHMLEDNVSGDTSITPPIKENIRRIRRSIHTIKGASAIVGLPLIADYCHEVEDYLDWLFEQAEIINPDIVANLTAAVDLLADVIEASGRIDAEIRTSVLGKLKVPATSSPDPFLSPTSSLPLDEEWGQDENEDKEILVSFLDESHEHLQEIFSAMQALANSENGDEPISSGQRQEIKKIRRCVHTIKGAAAVIGLNDIAGYAHKVEDLLDWLYETADTLTLRVKETLQSSLDFLGKIIEEPGTQQEEQRKEILTHLDRCLKKADQNPAPAEPAVQETQDADIAVNEKGKLSRADEQDALKDIFTGEGAKTLRVNKSHVDNMVNLANELLVGVSGFEQRMKLFKEALSELELTKNRLKDIAGELETDFEVKALDDLGLKFSRTDDTLASLHEEDGYTEFDSMELDRYTQLNLIIRSLNEVSVDAGAIQSNMSWIYSDIDSDVNRQRRNIRELQLQIMRTRMSPLSSITARLGRTMRDVGAKLGKKVQLRVEGGDIELDRVVWEKLADPFMHLIRNAVHHGIERKEERQLQGKSITATITLSAKRRGNRVILRFSDDGQGLDFEKIREKAKNYGLGDRAETLTKKQLTDLIFRPGFSTKTISEISGRGVGLDVVRENIQELQGGITIDTERHGGTDFIITLPLTLGVVKGLIVQLEQHRYAIPVSDIREIRRLSRDSINEENGTATIENKQISFFSLAALMGINQHKVTGDEERPLLLILDLPGEEVAVEIPGIAGQQELVVKDLGNYLQSVKGVSGASVLGDGSIVPVLNINDLALTLQQPATAAEEVLFHDEAEKQNLKIMIIDDSISVRRVVHRFVSSLGWEAIEAKDGLDAMEKLESVHPDFILLDVEMPRMNGFEFLSKIRNIKGKSDIPIAMLTSRTSVKHREKAFGLGAKGFLNKPYKDEELVELVTQLTGFQLEDGTFVRTGENN